MNQTELKKLALDIQKLEERRIKIYKSINSKTSLLKANCPHKKLAIKRRYVEGGYLDKSEDHEITYCTLCGTELKDKISYGWFS